MDEEGAFEETVMLTRRARRARAAQAPAGEPAAADEAIDEHTVVIDRAAAKERTAADEHTVVMRRPPVDEQTVVMRRPVVDERTVVVDRGRRTDAEATAPDLDPSIADTVKAPPPRRETAEPAPAIYKPRPAPLVPSRPPAVADGVTATRDTSAVTASVLRRSRRAGMLAVVSVGAACVVSVAGLVTLGFVLLG